MLVDILTLNTLKYSATVHVFYLSLHPENKMFLEKDAINTFFQM